MTFWILFSSFFDNIFVPAVLIGSTCCGRCMELLNFLQLTTHMVYALFHLILLVWAHHRLKYEGIVEILWCRRARTNRMNAYRWGQVDLIPRCNYFRNRFAVAKNWLARHGWVGGLRRGLGNRCQISAIVVCCLTTALILFCFLLRSLS